MLLRETSAPGLVAAGRMTRSMKPHIFPISIVSPDTLAATYECIATQSSFDVRRLSTYYILYSQITRFFLSDCGSHQRSRWEILPTGAWLEMHYGFYRAWPFVMICNENHVFFKLPFFVPISIIFHFSCLISYLKLEKHAEI